MINFTIRRLARLVLLLLALLAVACDANEETDFGTEGLPPAAVLEGQDWLAERLAVDPEMVEISELEQTEFSDSCLGLGGPAESCLAVITPGWTTTMVVNDVEYEVRVNETGSSIRSPEFPAESAGPIEDES